MDARGYRRSGPPSGRAPTTQAAPPRQARPSFPTFRLTDHTALRRPVELRPSSPGHTPPGPDRWRDTRHKTAPDPSDRPLPGPSTPDDPPAATHSTTAATTTPAPGHTQRSSDP